MRNSIFERNTLQKMKSFFILVCLAVLGLALQSCNEPTLSTVELYHLEEGELLNSKIAAIKGDVRAAERVSDYYLSRRKAKSDGLEWTIVAARLGSIRARNFLEAAAGENVIEDLVKLIKAEVAPAK